MCFVYNIFCNINGILHTVLGQNIALCRDKTIDIVSYALKVSVNGVKCVLIIICSPFQLTIFFSSL